MSEPEKKKKTLTVHIWRYDNGEWNGALGDRVTAGGGTIPDMLRSLAAMFEWQARRAYGEKLLEEVEDE